jgi:O-antigen/teichoic acid export membrane protein
MGLMLVRLLIMARVMDLPSFAIFSAGLLISSSFCMLACLGLQPLLQRELPMMIVRQRERAGSAMLVQCAIVALACALVSASIVAGFGISFAGLSPTLVVIALLHGLSQQLFVVATVESRSRGASLRFAYQNLVRAVLMLPAAIAVALFADAAAVLATEALTSMLLVAWLLRKQLKAIPISIRSLAILAWHRLPRAAWRSALALLAVSILSFLLINLDRWLAAEQLPASAFAQYAFAWTIPMVAQSLQVVINASLFPFLARNFASNGRFKAYRVSVKVSLAILFGGAVASLPIWGVLDLSVSRWFGAYHGSRELFPVFLLISLLRLSDFWSSYLIVIGQEVRLLALNLMTAVVGAFAWWLVVQPDAGSMTISQVAALSLVLATVGYLVNAWSAWACSNGFRQEVA